MTPILSQNLTSTPLASLSLPPFHAKTGICGHRCTAFFTNGIQTKVSSAGLKTKLHRRSSRAISRCNSVVSDVKGGETGEKFEYQAEVSRLLDLIVHSLYSHKEVFLRELVSNASDALDKLRFLSVTDSSILGDAPELEIRIQPDPKKGTLTIMDTGIGMTRQELIDCLGTIAQSGTSKFLKALKENKDTAASSSLIGQFGVGFYSAFLVADKVVVSTKSPKSNKQYVWEAVSSSSSYTIKEEENSENMLRRGTKILLYLRGDDKYDFSEPTKIKDLVKNYSQFVGFPIYTWQQKTRTFEVEEESEPYQEPNTEAIKEAEKSEKKMQQKTEKYWEWELANDVKPIWMRNQKEVQKSEYHDFFMKTFNEYVDPHTYTHFRIEGEVDFKSVLYIPAMGPRSTDDLMSSNAKNIRLYVKRIFISDEFHGELFPRYLSFVKGVVDSDDLPLNVSREILQESRIVTIMRKKLVRKTFDMVRSLAELDDKKEYKRFWDNFGKFLKIGCIEDPENHKYIAPFLRFYSSKSEAEFTGLENYVKNMDEKQKSIYYFAADNLESAKNAPFIEKLIQRGKEVLYLIDPLDEVALHHLDMYQGKKFVDISKEDLRMGDEDEIEEREIRKEHKVLCEWMAKHLKNKVAKVEISKRLSSSPCVLVTGKFGWSANMEKFMKAQAMGDSNTTQFMKGRRILEINPDHPIIKDLSAASKKNPDGKDSRRALDLLYDTALIAGGFYPENPSELGNRIYEMMAIALGGRWGRVEKEEDDDSEACGDIISDVEHVESNVIEPSEVREDDPTVS